MTGICGSGIVEVIAELFLAGVITADGIVDGALAPRTARIVPDGRTFSYVLHDGQPRIVITQNDVRAIQLAKAALYAGVRLLMDHAGVEAVDEIRLAGAFGSQIDPTHAMILGLIPDCDLAHVRSAGNAAGTGALIALLSRRGPDRDRGRSSGGSRRSRPRSSRASRSTSSTRSRSRTGPPASTTWPGSSSCRAARPGDGERVRPARSAAATPDGRSRPPRRRTDDRRQPTGAGPAVGPAARPPGSTPTPSGRRS